MSLNHGSLNCSFTATAWAILTFRTCCNVGGCDQCYILLLLRDCIFLYLIFLLVWHTHLFMGFKSLVISLQRFCKSVFLDLFPFFSPCYFTHKIAVIFLNTFYIEMNIFFLGFLLLYSKFTFSLKSLWGCHRHTKNSSS